MTKYSEKEDDCQAKDKPGKRRIRLSPFWIGVGALAAGAAWAAGTTAYTWAAMHPPRFPVFRPPGNELPLEDIEFQTPDDVCISGWFVQQPEALGTIILCHGHPMNRVEMLVWARLVYAAGFNALLFDFRAMGRSGGDLCTIGHYEIGDLVGAVDFLAAHPTAGRLPVGVFGISMGGAVCLMAAAIDSRIGAVATHGAYATLDRAITQRGRMMLGPAGPVFSLPALYLGKLWFGIDSFAVSPLDVVSRISPRPVMITHGELDITVSPKDAKSLYAAALEPKELYIMPRSFHIYMHTEERAVYNKRLTDFFTTHLSVQTMPAIEPSADKAEALPGT